MTPEATLRTKDSGAEALLYMALELSWKTWRVLFWHGGRQRGVDVPGRDLAGLGAAIGKARTHFGLAAGGRVVSRGSRTL